MTSLIRPTLAHVESDVLAPTAARHVAHHADDAPDVWVHRYREPETGWRLSIATLAAPGSGKLSLGGFRIAPETRTSIAGYDNDVEAIGLALGMDGKVQWSRVLRVGGPLALRNLDRIVGGKCVLLPTADARVGQPRDRELLDFAVACLHEVEATAGFHVTTGQDLGHGRMHDGTTASLDYLHDRFAGSVRADTSRPTAEGNFQLLRGMLAGVGIALADARVALVGAGNIGSYVMRRLRDEGARVTAVDPSPATRERLDDEGLTVLGAEQKLALLGTAVDAVVVNAAGGSLDDAAVRTIAANRAVRVVCGSENLAMPDAAHERVLLAAGKLYAPTELGGMMGYLTAVEEYLAKQAHLPFQIETLIEAAARLDDVGRLATERAIAQRMSFRVAAGSLSNDRSETA